jgi:hypothetical protein
MEAGVSFVEVEGRKERRYRAGGQAFEEAVMADLVTEQLVETVAKAIASADERHDGPSYETRMSMEPFVKDQLFDEARSAIKATLSALEAAGYQVSKNA